MQTKREVKISFIKNDTNYNNIKEIYCDSKSLFNKSMLFLSVLFAVVIGYFIGKTIYFDFINKRLNYNFTNIISLLGILLLTISPAIYYIFKMINFKFYINNEKINYKNIFGKTFSYPLTEILKAEYFASIGESTDRNFELLRPFRISKNLLVK